MDINLYKGAYSIEYNMKSTLENYMISVVIGELVKKHGDRTFVVLSLNKEEFMEISDQVIRNVKNQYQLNDITITNLGVGIINRITNDIRKVEERNPHMQVRVLAELGTKIDLPEVKYSEGDELIKLIVQSLLSTFEGFHNLIETEGKINNKYYPSIINMLLGLFDHENVLKNGNRAPSDDM